MRGVEGCLSLKQNAISERTCGRFWVWEMEFPWDFFLGNYETSEKERKKI